MNLLVRPALNYISLSAVWCALMLYFIPVSLFSWLMLRENFQLGCLIGIPAAVGAVYFASRRLTREGENKLCLKTGPFLLLCALAVCNGLAPLVMKLCSRYAVLPDGEDPLVKYRIAFLFWFYAGIALPSFWDFARFSASEQRWSRLYLCAAVMTIGSLGGMGIQCRLMQAPAALVFPTINVTSVLLVGIVSLLFFREKMTVSRLVTIGLALLTILTFSICG